jgi:hypothetical protein
MVLFRLSVFAAAATLLAGCCASSSGCYVAEPGIPTAWDGAGARPDDAAPPRRQSTARMARAKTEVSIAPIANARAEAGPSSERDWAEKEAADRDADARLTKQLMICRGCLPEREDDATGSTRR